MRSEEEQYQAERGNAVLGGDNIDNSAFDHHCRRCRHRWVPGSASTSTITSLVQPLSQRRDQNASPAMQAQLQSNPPSATTRTTASEEALAQVRLTSPVTLGPSVVVFILAWVIGLALIGGAVCSDGWGSSSIGHNGACSHHGGVFRLPGILAIAAAVIIAITVHSFRKRWAGRKLTIIFKNWLFEDY